MGLGMLKPLSSSSGMSSVQTDGLTVQLYSICVKPLMEMQKTVAVPLNWREFLTTSEHVLG